MSGLEAKLRHIRPTLFVADNFQAHIVLAFAVFNIGLAVQLLPFPGLLALLPYPVWSAIFFLLGLWMFWALFTKNWAAVRSSLFAGITVKCILLFATILTGNWIIAWIWALITWLQILSYTHFPGGHHDER